MLRLFAAQRCHVLWDCSHRVASCVSKRRISHFLPVNSASHHRVSMLVRHFRAGSPVWKDDLPIKTDKSGETETVDLDRWKSVMRSQAAVEEKQGDNEAEASDDGEDLKEPGGDLKDGSLLEATRDLVVMWRHAGRFVPQEMTDEEVKTLAQLATKSARKKYLKYLALKESNKRSNKEKKQKKRAEKEAAMNERSSPEEGDDQSGHALKNTFLLQFWNRSMEKQSVWRTAQAMMFGQPLVFDMSYESYMSRREMENVVSQLLEVEGCNRRATDPYHLHFCNLQPHGPYMQNLLKRYGAETWDNLLITSTDRQHVELFPHEQLVYLTADSPNVLHTYDHSKVYIIGTLVDRSNQPGLSLANAKRLKLATARLPLDEFLHWDIGGKNMTLDQMMRIMLTIKDTGKWEEALKFVPTRKHDGFYQDQMQITNNRVRGVTSHGLREDSDRLLRFGERNGERPFKSRDQSHYKSYKESGFNGRDRMAGLTSDRKNTPPATKVRTSFKSNMDTRKSGNKYKMWWHE